MKIKYYIFFVILFISRFIIAQEISFTTQVSKNKLGLNQRLRIEFSINQKDFSNFKPPAFHNFKLVAGPSSSVQQSWVNGKSSYEKSYTYIIAPKSVGVFTLPPATIQYKGKEVLSNTPQITVTKEVATPKNPNDPDYIAQENVALVASISNKTPYLGESIYVEYRLYFSDKIRLGETEVGELPKNEGFWNQEIPIQRQELKEGMYKGEQYRYYILKRTLLIPQKTGKLYIDPIEMDMVIGVPTGRRDFFGRPEMGRVRSNYSSKKQLIRVKELPTVQKPLDFNGAVGDFNFKVSASKTTLKANESTQLKLSISGKGNLKLFELPKLSAPSELEVYTPERKQRLKTTYTGIKGRISDDYAIVPEYKGKYKIPAVSFSYFNPKDHQYHSIKSNDIIIEVTEGKELPTTKIDAISKKKLSKENANFKYIQTSTVFTTPTKDDFYLSKLFYLLLAIPFLAIPIGVLIARKRKKNSLDLKGNKSRIADKLAKKYLSEAKKELGNKEAFYIALEKALHNFLKASLNIETSDISKDKIAKLLTDYKVEQTVIQSFIKVLSDCDLARYAPASNLMMQEEYDRAKTLINKINTALK